MALRSGQDQTMRTTADNDSHQYEIAIGVLIMILLMPVILVLNLILHPAPAPHLCMAADWPLVKTGSCSRGLTTGGVCL